jgi:hypothetical protein
LDQVNSLRQEREQQDAELQKADAKAREAMNLATEEASKLKTAKDVINSLTAQVMITVEFSEFLSILELVLAPSHSSVMLSQHYMTAVARLRKPGDCSLSNYVTHLDFVVSLICIEATDYLSVISYVCCLVIYDFLMSLKMLDNVHIFLFFFWQLKEMSERLPPGACDVKNNGRVMGDLAPEMGREKQMRYGDRFSGLPAQVYQTSNYSETAMVPPQGSSRSEHVDGVREFFSPVQQMANGGGSTTIGYRYRSDDHDRRETDRFQINLQSLNTRSSSSPSNQVDAEWIEQYEPGVYLTLVSLRDGTKELKRVRFRYQTTSLLRTRVSFPISPLHSHIVLRVNNNVSVVCSRRRFGEHQAESWWKDNCEKVYDKYNVCGTDRLSSVTTA